MLFLVILIPPWREKDLEKMLKPFGHTQGKLIQHDD